MFRDRGSGQNPVEVVLDHPQGFRRVIAAIRSAIFNIVFFTVLPSFMLLNIPALLFKKPPFYLSRICSRLAMRMARVICGLRYRVVGLENVPEGACIFASKHQSAWDTFVFSTIYPDCSYVMKYELAKVPVYGSFIRKLDMIAIDRSKGRRAIVDMRNQAEKILKQRRKIVIFPEGSRTLPGVAGNYQKGVLALYKEFDCPVVPVALNSGLFWGRRSWIKWPGEITIEFLPPLPSGLPSDDFMEQLESRIEETSNRLAHAA